jgi:predicted transcriptional regulator
MSKRNRMQGELENSVLNVLWSAEQPLTSNEVLAAINTNDELALTTILTVLTRLQEKGLVVREASGRTGLFSTAQSRDEHVAKLLLEVLSSTDNPSLAISHFAKGLSKDAAAALKKSLG